MITKVKVSLKKNETVEEAEEKLFKALESQRTGESHKEAFSDPAMSDLEAKFNTLHEEMYDELLNEIFEELDKVYSQNY